MPYTLPPDAADFTGRGGAVAELTDALAPAGPMRVAAVGGMGGVGKTALAVHAAHLMRGSYPGGLLFADLSGDGDRPADPYAVLGGLLEALGHAEVPGGLEERAALYRSELAGRRTLVLLDGARDRAHVRPLLPGTPGAGVLVTSRVTMAGLPGVRLVDLDVLEPAEAVALLGRVVGRVRIATERSAALDLVAACGFLPLAVRAAGERLIASPWLAVGELARSVARDRLGELPSVDACLRRGQDRLSEDQARAFHLLAPTGVHGFTTDAASAALGIRRHRADDVVDSLVDRSLLECVAPGRYRYHELNQALASREAADSRPPAARAAALRGLLGFHLASAREARRVMDLGEPCGHRDTRHRTVREARTWLFTEHAAILAAVETAVRAHDGPIDLAADLVLVMAEFLDNEWDPRAFERAARAVRDAARGHGAISARARAECALGLAAWWRGDLTEADRRLRTAALLGSRPWHGDRYPAALALDTLTVMALADGRISDAASLSREAEETWGLYGDRRAEARAHVVRGRLQLERDTPAAAAVSCTRGLRVYLEAGDAEGTSQALYELGVALRAADRSEEALDRFAESLAYSRALGARPREAHNLTNMAEAFLDCGRPAEAVHYADQALAAFDRDATDERGHAMIVYGRALDAIGNHAGAQRRLAEACELLAGEDGPALGEARQYLERLRPRD